MRQTIRYHISKWDEDAPDQAWEDWLANIIRFANGDSRRETFSVFKSSVAHYCQMDFFAEAYLPAETFPFDDRDANHDKDSRSRFSVFACDTEKQNKIEANNE